MKVLNFVVLAVVLAVSVGMWLIFRPSLPPQVPLYYGLSWGENQLAETNMLLVLPGVAILVATVSALGIQVFKLDKTLSTMLLSGSMVTQLLLAVGLIRIVLLVA